MEAERAKRILIAAPRLLRTIDGEATINIYAVLPFAFHSMLVGIFFGNCLLHTMHDTLLIHKAEENESKGKCARREKERKSLSALEIFWVFVSILTPVPRLQSHGAADDLCALLLCIENVIKCGYSNRIGTLSKYLKPADTQTWLSCLPKTESQMGIFPYL